MVDEEAHQAIADRTMDEESHHTRIDPAGERAQHATAAHAAFDGGDLLVEEALDRPVARKPRHAEEEVLEQLAANRGVHDLGVELHEVPWPAAVPRARHSAVRCMHRGL